MYRLRRNKSSEYTSERTRHFSQADRQRLEFEYVKQFSNDYKCSKITVTYLTTLLDFNKSTISRELKKGMYERNMGANDYQKTYICDLEQAVALEGKKRSSEKQVMKYDNEALKLLRRIISMYDISIETACQVYKELTKNDFPVSVKTIYSYIEQKKLMFKNWISK